MSNHSSVLKSCYKSFHQKKKYLAECKIMFLCGHAPWCGMRTCPEYFSTRDNLPGHLAICVNIIIIMCIGLVHDIFTRNIYDGIDMKIDN